MRKETGKPYNRPRVDYNRQWNVHVSRLHYVPYDGTNTFSRLLTPEMSFAVSDRTDRGSWLTRLFATSEQLRAIREADG